MDDIIPRSSISDSIESMCNHLLSNMDHDELISFCYGVIEADIKECKNGYLDIGEIILQFYENDNSLLYDLANILCEYHQEYGIYCESEEDFNEYYETCEHCPRRDTCIDSIVESYQESCSYYYYCQHSIEEVISDLIKAPKYLYNYTFELKSDCLDFADGFIQNYCPENADVVYSSLETRSLLINPPQQFMFPDLDDEREGLLYQEKAEEKNEPPIYYFGEKLLITRGGKEEI